MDFLRKFGQQLAQLWQGMTPARRLMLSAAAAVCLAVVGGVWYWASQTEYAVLYYNLDPETAGAVTGKLQTQGVPFRLAAGGTTVLVPADQVHQRRIELAVDGLPAKGGKGFELFDSAPLGMTPFTQNVNYLRALQAELAKTIMHIEPITLARVHIARPDPSPFLNEKQPPTASVMIRLRPGTKLPRKTAAGIMAFVAHSVEGLTADKVTLVDEQANVLSDGQGSDGSVNAQMDYRRELETYLSSKAEAVLAQILGAGHATVKVTADINFQRQHEKKETYSPDGRVLKSETISQSKTVENATGSKGVAGAASNLSKQPSGSTAEGNRKNDEVITSDYLVSKVTQELEDKVGAIERLSIAATVDLSAAPAPKDGQPFALADAMELIKTAVGFKANRDEISVKNVKLLQPPPPPPPEPEPDTFQNWQNIINLVRNATLGLAALVGLALAWTVLRKVRGIKAAPAAPAPAGEAVRPQPKLLAALQQNPEVVAKLLAEWLKQSERPERQERKAA
jgi:flagellar M-ring protein FliF